MPRNIFKTLSFFKKMIYPHKLWVQMSTFQKRIRQNYLMLLFMTNDSGGPKSGKLQCIFRYECMNINKNIVTYRIGGRSLRVVIWYMISVIQYNRGEYTVCIHIHLI